MIYPSHCTEVLVVNHHCIENEEGDDFVEIDNPDYL